MAGRNPKADHDYWNPSEASVSFNPKEGQTQEGYRRLLIDPMENVLIGSILIRKYLGISSVNTMYMWHERYGLPILKRPDGQWMTTMTAIDEWIFMGSILEREKRPFPRSTNLTPQKALEQAQRRVEAARLRREEGMNNSEAYAYMRDQQKKVERRATRSEAETTES